MALAVSPSNIMRAWKVTITWTPDTTDYPTPKTDDLHFRAAAGDSATVLKAAQSQCSNMSAINGKTPSLTIGTPVMLTSNDDWKDW